MLLNKINDYLKESSTNSVFKINIEENGGYLKFSNSGQRGDRKFFTIGLSAINSMLIDIKNNISEFQKHTTYVEQNWRDLSHYYTDETIKSIATVQTKPLFVTINKLINWANEQEIANENNIDLSQEAIEKTINSLNELILFFTPNISKKEKENFTNDVLGKLDFSHKNLLLKGVPGTGKSKTIDNIIENDLDMNDIRDNVLRINIHSASSNSDLMQGISISTDDKSNILYQEKRGAVLKHIFKAMFKPKQPFVLVLEEIQENSLNELIGDLIYLIEKDKRTKIELEDDQELSYQELFEKVKPKHFVELPNLVEGSESNIKMIMPDNLYVFCTSNYRDDKKVIEDNLLRRFDVVEIYPQTQETLGEGIFKSKEVSYFLSKLNTKILEKFKDEIHPDRYLVGHANWLNITEEENDENRKLFYTALLKVLIEFKEIREVEFEAYAKEIVESVCTDDTLADRLKAYINACDFEYKSYKEMVEKLQKEIYSFLK